MIPPLPDFRRGSIWPRRNCIRWALGARPHRLAAALTVFAGHKRPMPRGILDWGAGLGRGLGGSFSRPSPPPRGHRFALMLPFQPRPVSDASRHADLVKFRSPSLCPCAVQHGSGDVLCATKLVDGQARIFDFCARPFCIAGTAVLQRNCVPPRLFVRGVMDNPGR